MAVQLSELTNIISNYVDIEGKEVTNDSKFIEDLGFNSYDFMSFLGEIEDEFDVEVDEREVIKIRTVGEAIAYIESLQA